MSSKPRLLGIVYEPGNFQPLLLVAREGVRSGRFDMILWSPYAHLEGDRFRDEALANGCLYVEETTKLGSLADIHGPLSSWLSGKPARLPVGSPASRRGFFTAAPPVEKVMAALDTSRQETARRAADLCERRTRFCEDWLVRLGVDTILFAEDNVERDSFAWIAAARRRGIRTVVASYGALSANEAEAAYAKSPAHKVDGHELDLVRRHLPHWLRQGNGYAITRLPFMEMLGREIFGLAPFDPWLVNSNGADVIALESRAMERIYRSFGFPSGQLHAVGHPLQDRLAEVRSRRMELRRALAERHGHDPSAPLIVVAMPPDQLGNRPSPFDSYADLMAAFAILPAQLTGAAVVVSPHPNITGEQKQQIVALGGKLEDMSAAELLPLADLYLTCVSSTIKWALGLGIPVIDFDCYGYNYTEYLDLPQVRPVKTVEGLSTALEGWSDAGQRERLEAAARDGAAEWGDIDGNALERVIGLCLGDTL
ncbi:hypothetical protein [Hoeflea sp.]|uniref:hypothetical protein n=1 Tax=Hoeflea sp. TaxID=1940281 RepID=UPI003BB14E6D